MAEEIYQQSLEIELGLRGTILAYLRVVCWSPGFGPAGRSRFVRQDSAPVAQGFPSLRLFRIS
jgi:hypothetical protein